MEHLSSIAIALLILVLAFMLCRELLCWYWKVNEISKLLSSLLQEQKRTNRILSNEPDPIVPTQKEESAEY